MNLNLFGLDGITEFYAIETHSGVRVYRVCCVHRVEESDESSNCNQAQQFECS